MTQPTNSAQTPGEIGIRKSWVEALEPGPAGAPLDRELPGYFLKQRWFRSKARTISAVRVSDSFDLGPSTGAARLVLAMVTFAEGEPETYALGVSFVPDPDHPRRIASIVPHGSGGASPGALIDAAEDARVAAALLTLVRDGKVLPGRTHGLRGIPCELLAAASIADLPVRPVGVEQSNTSYVFGSTFIAKVVRKVEAGESIELEILRQLGVSGGARVPELAGHLELLRSGEAPSTLLIAQTFAPNDGDAWAYVGTEVRNYYARVRARLSAGTLDFTPPGPLLGLIGKTPSDAGETLVGNFVEVARLLGRRTGELHRALSTGDDPRFQPEPWSAAEQRELHVSVSELAKSMLELTKSKLTSLPEGARELAHQLLAREGEVIARVDRIASEELGGHRIRVHGDYHLGQVLWTGNDFVIIDFEGEPARSIEWRRRKRSPIADVAGMLRSFHYAAVFGLIAEQSPIPRQEVPALEAWARFWNAWMGAAFLEEYLKTLRGSGLTPERGPGLALLLDVYLLEKALYEVGYELNNRPDWARIPLRGVIDVLDSTERAS